MVKIFVTGTDTGVGKTIISAWLAFHLKANYWKPIQTGERDSLVVQQLSGAHFYPESYIFSQPIAPVYAAAHEQREIFLENCQIPQCNNLIIEGAGGIMTPLNEKQFMIDLIEKLNIPVIIVARNILGAINHSILTINALKKRNIKIKAIVLNGASSCYNKQAIVDYTHERVYELPWLEKISSLASTPLPEELRQQYAIDKEEG